MATRTKSGGRARGTKNKLTLARLEESANQVTAIRKSGQKKATEVLNDLVHTAMGMVALYQRRVMTSAGLIESAKPEDVELFKEFMICAGTFAKALAPFQDPMLKAVFVQAAPEVPIRTIEGDNVIRLDDPVATGRVYQRMVKQIR